MANKGKGKTRGKTKATAPGAASAAAPTTAVPPAQPADSVQPVVADAKAVVNAKPGRDDDAPSKGKQRRAAQRVQRQVRSRDAVASREPVAEPAFFFGFEVTHAKLVIVRVLFFMLLALDALLQIAHAPRYGAGDFNVAQLPGFDAVAPGRELYNLSQLVIAYLFVLGACGVATRTVLPIATAIYGWLYFSSHLDSYQHHYLVWLLLLLSCFVPWQRPPDATPATPVRSWALRVMLIQLAVLYFWAAISKMNSAWLDGRTLDSQMSGPIESLIHATVGYVWAARLVIVVELTLAATIWWRRGWLLAAPLGLALHIGILKTGLEIGLFAWFMIALYALVIPDRIWVWLAENPPMVWVRDVTRVIAGWFEGSARFVVWVICAGAGAILAMLSRFDHGPAIGLGLVLALVIGTIFAVVRRITNVAWLAVAHLLAFVMWTAVDRATTTASDYYRFWGGSSRRLGDVKTAEAAYRQMTEVAPEDGNGYYQLGRLLLAREAGEEGLAAVRRAEDLEPLRARAYVAEARWLSTHGKRDEAIAKAREATIVEPTDAEAKSLLDSLTGSQ